MESLTILLFSGLANLAYDFAHFISQLAGLQYHPPMIGYSECDQQLWSDFGHSRQIQSAVATTTKPLAIPTTTTTTAAAAAILARLTPETENSLVKSLKSGVSSIIFPFRFSEPAPRPPSRAESRILKVLEGAEPRRRSDQWDSDYISDSSSDYGAQYYADVKMETENDEYYGKTWLLIYKRTE